jgi:hypothetical protein
MGASGIILAAAGAHAAPGAGLDSAGYMLLFHAAAVLGGAALLQQGVLLWPLAFAALVAWVLGTLRCAPSPSIGFFQWRLRREASF